MTSSVYGKGVKRVQFALIQAITTMVDLFLLNSGCKSYLNNYVLKMKFPLTQEEISYRENLSNRVNAISATSALFSDVETKSTRLRMLKSLVSTLNYGDELLACIDDEIKEAETLEQKAKEVEKEEAVGEETTEQPNTTSENDDLNLDLENLPSAVDSPQESLRASPALTPLTEDTEFLDEATDLPKPEELGDIDFSENN